MNRNVRIAKELVRLAKSLVSSMHDDFVMSDAIEALANGFKKHYSDKLNDIDDVEIDWDDVNDVMRLEIYAKSHLQDIPDKIMAAVQYSLASADFYEDEAEDIDDLVNQYDESAFVNQKSFEDIIQNVYRVINVEIYYGDFKNKLDIKKISERYYYDNYDEQGKESNVSSSISSDDYSVEKFGNWIKNSVEQSGISLV